MSPGNPCRECWRTRWGIWERSSVASAQSYWLTVQPADLVLFMWSKDGKKRRRRRRRGRRRKESVHRLHFQILQLMVVNLKRKCPSLTALFNLATKCCTASIMWNFVTVLCETKKLTMPNDSTCVGCLISAPVDSISTFVYASLVFPSLWQFPAGSGCKLLWIHLAISHLTLSRNVAKQKLFTTPVPDAGQDSPPFSCYSPKRPCVLYIEWGSIDIASLLYKWSLASQWDTWFWDLLCGKLLRKCVFLLSGSDDSCEQILTHDKKWLQQKSQLYVAGMSGYLPLFGCWWLEHSWLPALHRCSPVVFVGRLQLHETGIAVVPTWIQERTGAEWFWVWEYMSLLEDFLEVLGEKLKRHYTCCSSFFQFDAVCLRYCWPSTENLDITVQLMDMCLLLRGRCTWTVFVAQRSLHMDSVCCSEVTAHGQCLLLRGSLLWSSTITKAKCFGTYRQTPKRFGSITLASLFPYEKVLPGREFESPIRDDKSGNECRNHSSCVRLEFFLFKTWLGLCWCLSYHDYSFSFSMITWQLDSPCFSPLVHPVCISQIHSMCMCSSAQWHRLMFSFSGWSLGLCLIHDFPLIGEQSQALTPHTCELTNSPKWPVSHESRASFATHTCCGWFWAGSGSRKGFMELSDHCRPRVTLYLVMSSQCRL